MLPGYSERFINHYPDFLVLTTGGKAVLIEAKGDNLNNSESSAKLRLGRQWAEKAGEGFRYFMIYQTKDTGFAGTYPLDEFIGLMKQL